MVFCFFFQKTKKQEKKPSAWPQIQAPKKSPENVAIDRSETLPNGRSPQEGLQNNSIYPEKRCFGAYLAHAWPASSSQDYKNPGAGIFAK